MHNDDICYLLFLPLSWEDSDKFTNDSSYSDDILLQIKAKQKEKMVLKRKKRNMMKKCSICNESFTKKQYKFHLLSHSNKMIYHCKHCKEKFVQHETYVQHLSLHDSEWTDTSQHVYSKINYYYSCNFCDKQFRKKTEYRSHMISHSNVSRSNKEEVKGCSNLVKVDDQDSVASGGLIHFKNRNSSEEHLFTKKSGKGFHCNFCKRGFKSHWHMLEHVRIHTGERPYKCHICGVDFLQSGNFHKHMRSHGNARPFQCKNCGKRFSLYTQFQFHLSSQCLDGKDTEIILDEKFNCHVVVHKMEINELPKYLKFVDAYHDDNINNNCIEMMKFNMDYRIDNVDDEIDRSHVDSSRYHENIGSGIENDDRHSNVNQHDIMCKLCRKPFLHERYLYRHMRVDHGKSDPLCTSNELKFDRKLNNVSDKNKIVRRCAYPLNMNQQYYVCDICDKIFAYRNNVIKHKRAVHKISDVYSCKECSVSFSTYKEWYLHKKSFHGIHTRVEKCLNKKNSNKEMMKSYRCRPCNHTSNLLCNYKQHLKTYKHKQRLKEYIVQQKRKVSSLASSMDSSQKMNEREDVNKKSMSSVRLSNEKVTCNICHKQYGNKHVLKHHMILHNKFRNLYSCKPCGKKFNYSGNYKIHLKTKRHERRLKEYRVQQKKKMSSPISSNYSLKSANQNENTLEGMKRKKYPLRKSVKSGNENKLECMNRKKYPLRKEINSHNSLNLELLSNDNEKFTCNICHKQYLHAHTLKKHWLLHKKHKKLYSCIPCEQKFNDFCNYKKHLETSVHQRKLKEFIVQQKDKKSYSISLNDSLQSASEGDVKLDNVNRKKSHSNTFKFEQQSKSDEKVTIYRCELCDHKSNLLGNYKKHLLTIKHQTRYREYIAQQKKRKLSFNPSKGSLNKSISQKDEKRNSVNSAKFSKLQSNIDKKVMKYSCKPCGHKFSHLGNYKQHLKTMIHQRRRREYIAQQKKRKYSSIPLKDSHKTLSRKENYKNKLVCVNRKSDKYGKLSKLELQYRGDEKVMKYSCKPCDHKFNQLGNYKQHLKTMIHQRRRREYIAQQKKRKYSSIPLKDSLKPDSKKEDESDSIHGRRFLKSAINKQILKCEAGVKDCSITMNNFTNL